LCKTIAALRLDDEQPPRPRMADSSTHIRSAAPTKPTYFDVDRPRWAPQFLPNSVAAAKNPARTALRPEECTPPSESQPWQIKAMPSRPCLSGPKPERKESRFFPVSAFLACPDPSGRYPSKSRFLETKCVQKDLHCSEFSITSTSSSRAQNAATTAAYRALASKSLRTVSVPPTHDTDIRQEKSAPLSTPIQTTSTSYPVILDCPIKANTPPTMSTTPWIRLAYAALLAEHETANGQIQAPSLAYGFAGERPYLDDARTIANPRFHGRWQRPVVVALDTPLTCSDIPPQSRKRSRFFADGELIWYGGSSAAQRLVAEGPALTAKDVTTDTDITTPTAPGNSSQSPFIAPYDGLEAEHAWNTYSTPGARSASFATADVSSLDTATSPGTHDGDDLPQHMSPLRQSNCVDLDPPIQDHRRPIFNTVCRLETDIEKSIADLSAAGYYFVSTICSQDS
jgi:hypothetical protein